MSKNKIQSCNVIVADNITYHTLVVDGDIAWCVPVDGSVHKVSISSSRLATKDERISFFNEVAKLKNYDRKIEHYPGDDCIHAGSLMLVNGRYVVTLLCDCPNEGSWELTYSNGYDIVDNVFKVPSGLEIKYIKFLPCDTANKFFSKILNK